MCENIIVFTFNILKELLVSLPPAWQFDIAQVEIYLLVSQYVCVLTVFNKDLRDNLLLHPKF